MPWFAEHERSDPWYIDDSYLSSSGSAIEWCYSECERCNEELYVAIEFIDITPTRVIEIGLEDEMPNGKR